MSSAGPPLPPRSPSSAAAAAAAAMRSQQQAAAPPMPAPAAAAAAPSSSLPVTRRVGSGVVVADAVYENQRGTALLGRPRFSARGLLPTDRGPWSDAHGNFSLPRDSIQLPDPAAWEWISEWMVDMSGDVDPDGWQYSFNWVGFPWSPTCSLTTYVRRRRWVRRRRAKGPLAVPTAATTAAGAQGSSAGSSGGQAARPGGLAILTGPSKRHSASVTSAAAAVAAAAGTPPPKLTDVLRRHVVRADPFATPSPAAPATTAESASHSNAAATDSTLTALTGSGARPRHPPRIDRERLGSLAACLGFAMPRVNEHGEEVLDDDTGSVSEGVSLDDLLGGTKDDTVRREVLMDALAMMDYEVSKVHLVSMLMRAFPADRTWLATEGAAQLTFFANRQRLLQTVQITSANSSVAARDDVSGGLAASLSAIPPSEFAPTANVVTPVGPDID